MKELSVTAYLLMRTGRRLTARTVSRLASVGVLALLSACASTPYHDYPPQMPQVLTPEAGTTLRVTEPVEFSWRRTDEAESYDFHVFNADTSDIARYMKTDLPAVDVCSGDHCSINLYLSLPDSSRHAWRVRASNMAGKSAWTRTLFTFSNSAE